MLFGLKVMARLTNKMMAFLKEFLVSACRALLLHIHLEKGYKTSRGYRNMVKIKYLDGAYARPQFRSFDGLLRYPISKTTIDFPILH